MELDSHVATRRNLLFPVTKSRSWEGPSSVSSSSSESEEQVGSKQMAGGSAEIGFGEKDWVTTSHRRKWKGWEEFNYSSG